MSGTELKEMIFKAGYNVRQIADLLDISEQHMGRLLSVKDIKVSLLKKVAEATNKSVYYWLNINEKNKSAKEEALYKDKYLTCMEHCNALQNEIILLKDEKKGRNITKVSSKS